MRKVEVEKTREYERDIFILRMYYVLRQAVDGGRGEKGDGVETEKERRGTEGEGL